MSFEQELSDPIALVASKALLEGMMEKSIIKGLFKPIPKQERCYQLKHWNPILVVMVLYKIMTKVIALMLSLVVGNIMTYINMASSKGGLSMTTSQQPWLGLSMLNFPKKNVYSFNQIWIKLIIGQGGFLLLDQ